STPSLAATSRRRRAAASVMWREAASIGAGGFGGNLTLRGALFRSRLHNLPTPGGFPPGSFAFAAEAAPRRLHDRPRRRARRGNPPPPLRYRPRPPLRA